ncbi:hypothetical protein Tco_0189248 [Tanacetum coccineum]
MAGLDFCLKHNMVYYLEKNDESTEFHQIINFLIRSSIHFALIASIRSDLLFDDADGIDTLNNQAIFDTIQLMRFLQIFLRNQLKDVPVPMDHFPVLTLTKKVLTFMVKKEDEGEVLERPSESQAIPSLTHPSKDQPKVLVRIMEVTVQAEKIKKLKSQIKQLKKKARPGRKAVKSSKGAPSVHTHTDWDAMDIDLEATLNDDMDYTLTQYEGKTEQQSTIKPDEGTNKQNEGTNKQNEGTDKRKLSTDSFVEGTADQNKLKHKEKEKGVELKDVEDIERPRPTSTRSLLTLNHLPKIDPKAKGKGKIKEEDESDTESEDITEAEKKFEMLANDEEMARKVQEEWEAEKEKKRLAEEEATKTTFTNERFLAQQRYEIIRNKLPSRTQMRNQMMTYLKHVGGKKHYDLKTKNFEEIQDERLIKDLNKKATGIKKDDSIKEESKEEYGVHTLMTKEGLVIHMLVEKKYPLRKKVLLQMLELKLESEEDSTMALELIRFVKKLIAELEHKDSDGNKEDL